MHGKEVGPWPLPEPTALAHLGRYTRGMILLPEHAPGTLREQSSSEYTNDFMGILHPREQNAPRYFTDLIFGSKLPEQIERT